MRQQFFIAGFFALGAVLGGCSSTHVASAPVSPDAPVEYNAYKRQHTSLFFKEKSYTPPYLLADQGRTETPLPASVYRPFKDNPTQATVQMAHHMPQIFWDSEFQKHIDAVMLSTPPKTLTRFSTQGFDLQWVMPLQHYMHPRKFVPCRQGILYNASNSIAPLEVGEYTLCRFGPKGEWLPDTEPLAAK